MARIIGPTNRAPNDWLWAEQELGGGTTRNSTAQYRPNTRTFYEGPDDVHTVGRNASKSEPAKVVVFFVKDKGAPLFVAAK